MDLFSLRDKVAVVTGGGSGIGLATARRFVAAGAKVVVADRRDSATLAESFGADFVQTDVSKEEDVAHLMSYAATNHKRIDIAVNNAGFFHGAMLSETTTETLEKHWRPNLLGVVYGIKHAAAHMLRGGSIINTCSIAGLIGMPTYGAYVASKFAVLGVTKTAAIELASRGIRVNCVCPGSIDTPMAQQGDAEAEIRVVKTLAPLGRLGKPEEVAALMHFLAADDCSYITGEAIVIDGGWLAGPSIAAFDRLASPK